MKSGDPRAGVRHPWPAPVAVAAVGLAGMIGVAVVRAGGADVFPTDPLGASALAAGAVAAAVARERLLAAGAARAAAYVGLLAMSLLAYQLAGLWAVVAWLGDGATAVPAVAVWNAAWIPPLALVQLGASAAVRAGGRRPAAHVLVPAMLGTTALVTVVLARPTAPFAGLPTIAPEAWRVVLAPVDAVGTLLGGVGLVLLPVALWRAALTSHGPVRARLGVAAVGTTVAPLTVVFCVLLAVARAPGQVEPELGSVAFLVALAGTSGVGAWCAVLAARGTVGRRHVAVVVRGTGLAAATLVVLAVGTLAVAPGAGLGPTAAALSVAATTVAVTGLAWSGTGALARTLIAAPGVPLAGTRLDTALSGTGSGTVSDTGSGTGSDSVSGTAPDSALPGSTPLDTAPGVRSGSEPANPDPDVRPDPLPPRPLPHLTPRECEVLGLLAEGASNAGIAAQLVVSDRTVDAHLRAVFHKLGLEPDSVVNRRVRAARIWLEQGR